MNCVHSWDCQGYIGFVYILCLIKNASINKELFPYQIAHLFLTISIKICIFTLTSLSAATSQSHHEESIGVAPGNSGDHI